MKRFHSILSISLCFSFYLIFTEHAHAQTAPVKLWDKTFGGYYYDKLTSLQITHDGGFVLFGESDSEISGDKSQACKGDEDYWVVKLDSFGNKQWDKTFGGSGYDQGTVIQHTSDKGFILGGWSSSGISGDKTEENKGIYDYWVVKIDSLGNKQWDKTIGGAGGDHLYSLEQTAEGGYILGGYSYSNISGDKTQNTKGYEDYWVVKLDENGNKLWDKTYGGSGISNLYSLQQTFDKGYILGGTSSSNAIGDKSEPSRGHPDYWVIKIDSLGNKEWDKTLGGSNNEGLTVVKQTTDGGYVLGGWSESGINGDKTQPNQGGIGDYWIVKLNSNGVKVWDAGLGGDETDCVQAIVQTSDGGYLVGGYTYSGLSGDKTEPNKGGSGTDDYWLVRLDSNGIKLWDKTIGGYNYDKGKALQMTLQGEIIIGAISSSDVGADKSEPGKGGSDFWIVKLGAEVLGIKNSFSADLTFYPNPTTGIINLELVKNQADNIKIFNALSQCIYSKNISRTEKNIQIDLSKEPKGIYTIQVISENQITTRKFVLQ